MSREKKSKRAKKHRVGQKELSRGKNLSQERKFKLRKQIQAGEKNSKQAKKKFELGKKEKNRIFNNKKISKHTSKN